MSNAEIKESLDEINQHLTQLDKDHEEFIGGAESADIAEALLILERVWIPEQ